MNVHGSSSTNSRCRQSHNEVESDLESEQSPAPATPTQASLLMSQVQPVKLQHTMTLLTAKNSTWSESLDLASVTDTVVPDDQDASATNTDVSDDEDASISTAEQKAQLDDLINSDPELEDDIARYIGSAPQVRILGSISDKRVQLIKDMEKQI